MWRFTLQGWTQYLSVRLNWYDGIVTLVCLVDMVRAPPTLFWGLAYSSSFHQWHAGPCPGPGAAALGPNRPTDSAQVLDLCF